MTVLSESGAPSGPKTVMCWQPPLLHPGDDTCQEVGARAHVENRARGSIALLCVGGKGGAVDSSWDRLGRKPTDLLGMLLMLLVHFFLSMSVCQVPVSARGLDVQDASESFHTRSVCGASKVHAKESSANGYACVDATTPHSCQYESEIRIGDITPLATQQVCPWK